MLVLALLNVEAIDAFSLALSNAAADAVALKRIGSVGDVAEQRVLVREQGSLPCMTGRAENSRCSHLLPRASSRLCWPRSNRATCWAGWAWPRTPMPKACAKLMAHLGTHEEIARMLGWAPTERWFNPGQRLADGRVGYLLSGRASPPTTPRSSCGPA